MNVSALHRERLKNRREQFNEANRRKRVLTRNVLEMVQSADDSEGITRVAFQEPLGALEQFVLRHHADDVAEKLGTGRTVHLLLDETVKPPELVIRYDDTESE